MMLDEHGNRTGLVVDFLNEIEVHGLGLRVRRHRQHGPDRRARARFVRRGGRHVLRSGP
ncbi:MAG: hypothetical protein ACLSVD_08955 [Eggerthellaceae bacterium]